MLARSLGRQSVIAEKSWEQAFEPAHCLRSQVAEPRVSELHLKH